MLIKLYCNYTQMIIFKLTFWKLPEDNHLWKIVNVLASGQQINVNLSLSITNQSLRHADVGEWMYRWRFLDLGTGWRWIVSFASLLINPRGMTPRYPDRTLGGTWDRSGWTTWRRKNDWPYPDSNSNLSAVAISTSRFSQQGLYKRYHTDGRILQWNLFISLTPRYQYPTMKLYNYDRNDGLFCNCELASCSGHDMVFILDYFP